MKEEIGKRLKECRLFAKLTQKQVADAIGTTTQQYQLYESGRRAPTPEYLVALSKLFNVTTDYILGLTDF